jgi:thiamine transport system permease protein
MLDKNSTRGIKFIFALALIFFGFIIFLPAVYILKYFTDFNIFSNPQVLKAVLSSFLIGLVVTILNLIFGIPLAWVIARSRSRFIKWIDNLVDLSLVMPTAALGFSIYLYWGSNFSFGKLFGLENGFISRGPVMIILLHLVFTIPYMIRSVAAAVQQLEASHEEAALTLGASPFTFFRTIALPLFRDGVINGSILSFTRSLSETGATMMVAGAFATAPVLIINLKDQGDLPAATGASIILIIAAVFILLAAKLLVGQKKINLVWAAPNFEKSISKLTPIRNMIIFSFFTFFIFLPTIYILFYSLSNFRAPDYFLLIRSLILSLGLAFLVTLVNLIFSVPFSYLIARNRYRIGTFIDTLSEVVLLMPTSALGLSLVLFWRRFIPSDLLILFLAHLSFSFPLLVKPITSAFKDISASQEEAAYSLGANIKKTFTSVLLPQIKPAIIAGSIMVFMRSLSETGATLAVTRNIKTVSVLIVDLFQSGNLATAAFVCSTLFIITIIFLHYLKKLKGQIINPG